MLAYTWWDVLKKNMALGIKCRRHKRFKVTTDSDDYNKLVYDNASIESF